jgi:hypothetical protein
VLKTSVQYWQRKKSGIIRERKGKQKMQTATHINDFIGSLPKIVEKKIWNVYDENGNVVQGVSASDNLKRTAQKYIDGKYPGRSLTLKFAECRGYITIPR